MAGTPPPGRLDLCIEQLWRVTQGDFSMLDSVQSVVLDSVGRREAEAEEFLVVCSSGLTALAAHRLGHGNVQPTLARLDSTTGSLWAVRLASLLSALIHWERRDYVRALAAVRRRNIFAVPFYEATFLRMEGDLASALGEREAAIDAYSKYLRLRSDPEPALIPERDEVRRKLADLIGEGRRE